MSKTGLKVVQVCLDPVSLLILNRLCGGKPKNRSHTIRRLLFQAWASRQVARRVPRLVVGRKKGSGKYCVIKNLGVNKPDFEELIKE